ncbi:hypothetical protein PI124_g5750 [Phytophthora idaei]|nr:hypothetical protein PI125_g7145 [Phytophthora idaei]KAG3163863.1 hypothetical protein PI126_g5340 [Phytophthora idaei]KAG3249581.1 hypothetical protein PI124_g5750 [Phytophthora idaei]
MATDVETIVAHALAIVKTLVNVAKLFLWLSVATGVEKRKNRVEFTTWTAQQSRDGLHRTCLLSSLLCSALRDRGTAWMNANEHEPRRNSRVSTLRMHWYNDATGLIIVSAASHGRASWVEDSYK